MFNIIILIMRVIDVAEQVEQQAGVVSQTATRRRSFVERPQVTRVDHVEYELVSNRPRPRPHVRTAVLSEQRQKHAVKILLSCGGFSTF